MGVFAVDDLNAARERAAKPGLWQRLARVLGGRLGPTPDLLCRHGVESEKLKTGMLATDHQHAESARHERAEAEPWPAPRPLSAVLAAVCPFDPNCCQKLCGRGCWIWWKGCRSPRTTRLWR